jgi:uncharacterized circularly permuted ATP-grasp superfamily protein
MKLPFDEMLDATGKARPHYQVFHNWLKQQSDTLMGLKRAEADLIFVGLASLLPSMEMT